MIPVHGSNLGIKNEVEYLHHSTRVMQIGYIYVTNGICYICSIRTKVLVWNGNIKKYLPILVTNFKCFAIATFPLAGCRAVLNIACHHSVARWLIIIRNFDNSRVPLIIKNELLIPKYTIILVNQFEVYFNYIIKKLCCWNEWKKQTALNN